MYQALYRKYRPKTFDDVVGQAHITQTLKSQVEGGRLTHAYLFTGTRGTGKTSCAKILAKAVNCQHPIGGNPCNECPSCAGIDSGRIMDVLEIDAASNNGVDHIRALRDEANYTPAVVKKRVYIVDEVHMLTTAAFNALLKILEEPPEHLLFILATTELNKVPGTILSRCQRFSFKRLTIQDIAGQLLSVAGKEQIQLEADAANLIARLSDGAMRDALSLLDQCAVSGKVVDCQTVYEILGRAGNEKTMELMDAIAGENEREALELFSDLYAEGKDIGAMLDELCAFCRDLLILKIMPENGTSLLSGTYDPLEQKELAARFTAETLIRMITILQNTQNGLSRSANRRIDAELCLIRLCSPGLYGDLDSINARLAKLEDALNCGTVVQISAKETDRPEKPVKNEEAAFLDMPPREEKTRQQWDPANHPEEPLQQIQKKSGDMPANFWPELLTKVKPDITIMEHIHLSNPAMAQADFKDGWLTITADGEFTLKVLNNSNVMNALKEKAETILGSPVQVRFQIQGARQGGDDDPFNDLIAFGSQFDNITIK